MTWGPRLPWAPWHRALGASLTWASSSGAWLASLATGSQQRVLFYRHLEKGCQPPGLMSAGMWVLFLGSISYFPGWHDSLARHWDGCWKTPKTHLHQMRGRASAFETGPMWFSYRARYAVPSQQTHVKRKKKKNIKCARTVSSHYAVNCCKLISPFLQQNILTGLACCGFEKCLTWITSFPDSLFLCPH